MSLIIPGMKMPTECWECPCAYETEGVHHNYCQAVGYDTQLPDEGRPDWCPLIELPPHGRLGDLDALAFEVLAVIVAALVKMRKENKK